MAGSYCYVGSALNGLDQRIARHNRYRKRMHWHIDYLLKHASIARVFVKPGTDREECAVATVLSAVLIPIPRFGSSDCRCRSHLTQGCEETMVRILIAQGFTEEQVEYFKR